MMNSASDLLETAAPAAPGPSADEPPPRLEVRVHDTSRLAWHVAVPLPERGPATYSLELEVEGPANLVGSLDPWAALQSYARLGGAAASHRAQPGGVETFRRAVVTASTRLGVVRDGFVRHCMLMRNSVCDERHAQALQRWLEVASAALGSARTQVLALAPEGQERRLADEFLSGQLWTLLTDCRRALDETRRVLEDRDPAAARALAPVEPTLATTLQRELAYRRQLGFAVSVNPRQLERLLWRMRGLKKHFERVLFLEVETYRVVTRWAGWVSAVMAVLAYLWFMFWQVTIERHPVGVGSSFVAFALLTAVAYASRERLKEIGREWLAGRVQHMFAQRVMRCRLPAHGQKRVGAIFLSARESFSQSSAHRPDPVHPECGATHDVVVLRFAHRGLLRHPEEEATDDQEIRLVYRLDLSALLPRLHDAVRGLASLDEKTGAVTILDVPRNYELPVRASLEWPGGREEVAATLVLNKNGLLRIVEGES